MVDYNVKQEIVRRIEEYGVYELFKKLGLKGVSRTKDNVYSVCPFHSGADNPNAFAYTSGFGYCFTQCHKKYDLFSIVMKVKGVDFPEAIAYLAELVGVSIDYSHKPRPIDTESSNNRDFLSSVKRVKSKKISKDWKPIDKSVFIDIHPSLHTMLRKEGFDEGVRDYFDLGYAQSGYLQGRITVPIDYLDGSVVTISGRSTLPKKELEALGIRRYQIWYSTDKSMTCYNISRALPYIEITKEVIVVEGFKSVWKLHQWGYRNVVALMGSNLSDEQRKLLLKLNAKIIVCGDRDEAGKLLNTKVYNDCKKYGDIEIIDMFMLEVPEKSSLDDIEKEQFLYLFQNRKSCMG